jgi:hypothetical protein
MSCLLVLGIKYKRFRFTGHVSTVCACVCQFFVPELFGTAIKMTGLLLCATLYVFTAEQSCTVKCVTDDRNRSDVRHAIKQEMNAS